MKEKNLNGKILLTIFLAVIITLSIFQVKSLASNQETLIVKESENKYIIYIDSMLSENFEYSFSNSKEETELNYINSAKDSSGNNIAYVDQEIKDQYFNSENTYLWVKSSNEEIVINGEEVILDDAIDENQIKSIESITSNITITADAKSEKITINAEEGKTYTYKIISPSENEEYKELINLVEEINGSNELDSYAKISKYNKLSDLYTKLLAEAEKQEWLEAKDQQITKPYEAKENQKYILWLKDSDGNVDVQILTAYVEEVVNVEEVKTEIQKEQQVEEEVKKDSALPYTYDELEKLVIALGIVLVAIVLVIAIKIINSKKTSKRG